MSFLHRSVSPNQRSNSPIASQCEMELSDSHRAQDDKVYVNTNEGKETSTVVNRVTNGGQEQLNGSSKGNVSFGSSLTHTGEKDSISRCQQFYRVVLLVMCLMAAASLALTLLTLFGVVHARTPQCTCSGVTGGDNSSYGELERSVQDLKKNISSLKEYSFKKEK